MATEFLFAALPFVFAGVALAVLAVSCGTKKRRSQTSGVNIAMGACLGLLTAALLPLPGCGQGELQVFNDIKGDTYANFSQYDAGDFTYTAADVDAIEIGWRAGSVELVESDAPTLSVSESGKDVGTDARMHHYLDGRTLRIQFCQSGATVHVSSADKVLTVEVPKGIDLSVYNTAADIHAEALEQKSVFVSSYSGKFDCGSLAADSIDLSSSSGSITLGRIEGSTIQVETASGKVEAGNVSATNAISCISVSGDLNFDTIHAGRLAIDTTSAAVDIGNLDCLSVAVNSTSGRLKLPLPEQGARLNFATVSGGLKTSLAYETVGDLRVFGDGDSEVNVVTISGDLELG